MQDRFLSRLAEAGRSVRRRFAADEYILALIIVCAFIGGVVHLTRLPVIENEGAEYATIARNVERGVGYIGLHGTPEVYFPPVYPFSIYLVSFLTNDVALAGRIVALVFGSLVAVLAGMFAGHWFGLRVGLIAAAVALASPLMIGASTAVLSETTYMACSLAGILLIWLAFERSSPLVFAAAGVAMGIAHLVKPEVMFYSALLLLVRSVFSRGKGRKVLLSTPLFFLTYALVIAPHILFLHEHTGKWMVEGKSGLNTAIAVRTSHGETLDEACRSIASADHSPGLLLHPMEEVPRHSSVALVLQHPEALPANVVRNFFPLFRASVKTYGYPLLLLAALGLIALGRVSVERCAYLAVAMVFPLILVSSFWIFGRYLVGILPLLAIAAAFGVSSIFSWIRKLWPAVVDRPGSLGILVVLLTVLTFTIWPRVNGPRSAFSQSHQRELKEAGEWLYENGGKGKRVMCLDTRIPFYADALWITEPLGPVGSTLAYASDQKADFIVTRSNPLVEDYLGTLSHNNGGSARWHVVHRVETNPYVPLVILVPGGSAATADTQHEMVR